MKMIKEKVECILKEVGLSEIKVKTIYNSRYKNAIASVTPTILDDIYILSVGEGYFELEPRVQQNVLRHEIAHVYDFARNHRASKHDKVFKDLCGKLYGNRKIGEATIRHY